MKKFKNKTTLKKLAAGAAAIAAIAFAAHTCRSTPGNDIIANSVTITNIAGTSGGSGTVLNSSDTYSLVLTNSHVCNVVRNGGKVTGPAGSFLVASYVRSKIHDLCMLSVEGNLRAETKIADQAPTPYYESASISGHPQLMPTVITRGHFSGRKTISVMKGMKPCTDEERNDPNTGLICLIVGGLPDITQYDATLVTATIMPGSSGSGVYNSKNELTAVAFAGQGDLGYAWAVPYESMKNFVYGESRFLQPEFPNNNINVSIAGDNGKTSEANLLKKLEEVCNSPDKVKIKDTCRLINDDIVYNK